MSRVAKKPITVPKGVEVKLNGQELSVKGGKGTASLNVTDLVTVNLDEGELTFAPRAPDDKLSWAMAGTMRALTNNMITGVSAGFERKLVLKGVGYRAQAQGKVLNLTLGFSHPVNYAVPEGVTVETPSQTEIVVKGIDRQAVGQVAADIRAYRPPEPYKGKGVRYDDEQVILKEAKKK